MAATQGLLHMALLALCWRPSGTQDTVPLHTLRCYNDYTSRIICSWADTEDAQSLVNLTLYRRLSRDEAVSCNLSENLLWSVCPLPHRCVPRTCVIPYNLFVLADDDYYSFRPDQDLGIQLTVPLAQHVQPPPPKDIQVSPSGDHFFVNWSAPLGDAHVPWLSQQDIAFEVAYRRLQDPWEEAANLITNNSWVTLEPGQLEPSSTYVARVRTLLSLGSHLSGRPSQWSTEVQWDSQPGDWAQPRNLQCFFDGAQTLACSWEVRTQLNGSVSFGLFYKSHLHAREEECSPVEEQPAGLFIRYRCGINVSDPSAHSQYTVSVKPRKQGKFIESSNHIQMPAPTLNVTKDGDSYSLRWKTEKMLYSHLRYKFQVQYKTDSENWEENKTENLEEAHSMALPALKPATTYWARARVVPFGGYRGTWSEWSTEISWTTEWALPMWGLALTLVLVTLALLVALRLVSVYGYRLNKRWKEKIPNPRKCVLFQDGPGGFSLPHSMAASVAKSPLPQGPRSSLFTELDGESSPHLGDSEVSPLSIEDPSIVGDPPSGSDTTPAASSECMEQPPDTQLDPSIPAHRPESQTPSFDFNGPYLGPPNSRSLPDLVGQSVPPQTGGGLKLALPGSLEYLCLPPGGQVQLVPLGQVMEQGLAVDVDCEPSLGAMGCSSMECEGEPGPELGAEGQDPRDNPVALPLSSRGHKDPVVASGYVTSADLMLTLPTGAQSLSPLPSLGSPSTQNFSLCLRVPRDSPETPGLGPQGFEGYVELPPSMSQPPNSSLCSPTPPMPSTPVVSLGEPREEVAPASPNPEGLLVLQQVGDYCFLPGLGPGPLSPRSKPSSPSLCPEMRQLDQILPVKKLPSQPAPQVPAIQFFKSLKQQDYLPLPPWDTSRPGEVC